MPEPLKLYEVFGVNDEPRDASYVDRGGLDRRLRFLLDAGRHIAIGGDSRQGKSWLRKRVLGDDVILLSCLTSSTPSQLLEQALGVTGATATLRRSRERTIEGQVELSSGGGFNAGILRAAGKGKASGGAARRTTDEEVPFAQEPAHLGWVAERLLQDGRRVVFENFHYIAEVHRPEMAEWIKTLGEYGLHVVVIGVWQESSFLSYNLGDLESRVEHVSLRWSDEELDDVLLAGCDALNIEMTRPLRTRLINAAYGNVGLLQRLADRLCQQEDIMEAQPEPVRVLHPGRTFERATSLIAEEMRARFGGFYQAFVQGGRGHRAPPRVYEHMLRALLTFSEGEQLNGVSSTALWQRMQERAPGVIARRELTTALRRIDSVQETSRVRPPVLLYDDDRRVVSLADRGLLFYERFGDPFHPWDDPDDGKLF